MDDLQKQKIELAIEEKELEAKELAESFPHAKRIILIVFAILIIPIFFVAKYATTAAYMYKFEKTQIVAHSAIFNSLPIEQVEVKFLPVTDNAYSAYALIKNPNKDLVVAHLKYTFNFYDASGKKIYNASDETFLLGGGQKYIILPNARMASTPAKVELAIADPVWKKRLSIPNIIVQTNIPTYADQTDPYGFSIDGKLQNLSTYTLRKVVVSGVVTDSDGKVIAVSQYRTDSVKAKDIREYKMFWPINLESKISSAPKIFVESNPLDENNLQ
jgi:hypothetical protein